MCMPPACMRTMRSEDPRCEERNMHNVLNLRRPELDQHECRIPRDQECWIAIIESSTGNCMLNRTDICCFETGVPVPLVVVGQQSKRASW
jgi:hypothetical protein